MISPEEYMRDEEEFEILSPDEYMGTGIVPSILSPEQYDRGLTKPKMEEQSFITKHPNLYGAFGVAQALIPYIKYIDPAERERFAKLSTQKQTRELLLQNLETIALVAAPAITKGVIPLVAKYLPKTYKAFKFIKTPIKEMGELRKAPAKEIAEVGLERAVARLAPKVKPIVAPKAKPVTEVPEPVIQKVAAAIKEAKPIRKAQEQIYSRERAKALGRAEAVGEKIPGERGFIAQLGQLKGELTKVEFQSIRTKVTQKDVDDLFKIVHKSQEVRGFQNLTAKKGLAKLFGQLGGRVPTEGELALLRKIFPSDFIQTLLKKRPLFQQMGEAGLQLANIPRSIMSSFDLSAPLRQGLFLSIAHPRRFVQSFVKMFRQFGSEKAYMAMQESIAQKRTFQLMQKSGLALTELGKGLFMREERFMSQWAERIPGLIGRGVRASGRAYTGFLNKLRADVFEDLVLKAERAGLNPRNNMDLTKAIARFINLASGRGGLGALEGSAKILNTFFFSPRLMASRLTLLNPVYYIKADPFVRKEALKSLFTLAGAAGTILAMARAAGLQVSLDPRTADFLKIRIGNTRIDILGGFQQYMRAAGQLISGQYISSTTGKLVMLGEGYKPLTRLDIAYRQIETKEAPIFSFITALMKGQDVKGEPISVPKEIGERFKPMALSDIYEIAKEDPSLLPISFLSMFGVGLQTYKGRPRKIKGGFKAIKGR